MVKEQNRERKWKQSCLWS